MVTLHPQSAMEHLHHRFVAADGTGSDGAIAFEATEVAATQKQRTLVPVRPAGAAGRRAGPLARSRSPTTSPAASPRSRRRRAGRGPPRAARSAGSSRRVQDLLPRRRAAYRRVTPAVGQRETQRRAAVAVLAFVVVIAGLLGLVWTVRRAGRQPQTSTR